jgi:hypothetical protein
VLKSTTLTSDIGFKVRRTLPVARPMRCPYSFITNTPFLRIVVLSCFLLKLPLIAVRAAIRQLVLRCSEIIDDAFNILTANSYRFTDETCL